MTHDELLAKMNTHPTKYVESALRAVVELHHPYTDTIIYCQECECLYPCPTIRAIKVELT